MKHISSMYWNVFSFSKKFIICCSPTFCCTCASQTTQINTEVCEEALFPEINTSRHWVLQYFPCCSWLSSLSINESFFFFFAWDFFCKWCNSKLPYFYAKCPSRMLALYQSLATHKYFNNTFLFFYFLLFFPLYLFIHLVWFLFVFYFNKKLPA